MSGGVGWGKMRYRQVPREWFKLRNYGVYMTSQISGIGCCPFKGGYSVAVDSFLLSLQFL